MFQHLLDRVRSKNVADRRIKIRYLLICIMKCEALDMAVLPRAPQRASRECAAPRASTIPSGNAQGPRPEHNPLKNAQEVYLRLITLPSLSLNAPHRMTIQSMKFQIPKPPSVRIIAIAEPVFPT